MGIAGVAIYPTIIVSPIFSQGRRLDPGYLQGLITFVHKSSGSTEPITDSDLFSAKFSLLNPNQRPQPSVRSKQKKTTKREYHPHRRCAMWAATSDVGFLVIHEPQSTISVYNASKLFLVPRGVLSSSGPIRSRSFAFAFSTTRICPSLWLESMRSRAISDGPSNFQSFTGSEDRFRILRRT